MSIGLFFLGYKEEKKMKTIQFFKDVHNVKEVWFYFEDEETKKALEKDLQINLSSFDQTVRFDSTFQTWYEVSDKLKTIYHQCGPENIFGGIVFVDYKKFLNKENYIVKESTIWKRNDATGLI